MARFSYLAVFLYLVPIAVLQIARARKDRALWQIALDVPMAVAIDMLSVLLLSRFVTLENAIRVSRPLWVLAGGAYMGVRARRARAAPGRWVGGFPTVLTPKNAIATSLSAILAGWISESVSRDCHVADRAWHIPLSSALRGQRLPFANVYEPGSPLGYHFAGDVFSAMFQVFSGDRLHSSLALSLAHDVAFAVTAASIALLVQSFGIERIAYVILASIAPLLASPFSLAHPDHGKGESGYNFVDFFRLSYRPHVPLAGLLIVGFMGAIAVRFGRREEGPRLVDTVFPLVLCTAALAITDEASIGLLGLAVGATWIVAPEVLHPRRLVGMAVLAALLVAVALPSRVLGGSLGPGAPAHVIKWVAWRAPGYFNTKLDLIKNSEGKWFVFWDVFPLGVTAIAGVLSLATRGRARARLGSVFFYVVLLTASVVLMMRIDVDKAAVEGHRFMTAALFLFPIVGVLWLFGSLPLGGKPKPAGAFPTVLIVGAISASALCSLESMRQWKKTHCSHSNSYGSSADFFTIDCKDYAVDRGAPTRPEYVEQHILYDYAGCKPIFAPGPAKGEWHVKIGLARFGKPAFQELHESMLPRDQPMRLICPIDDRIAQSDVACAYAIENKLCTSEAPKVRTCLVSAKDRSIIMAEWSKPPVPKPGAAPAEEVAPVHPTTNPEDTGIYH